MKKSNKATSLDSSLKTLAQNGTGNRAVIVYGIGSDANNDKALKGRAKRKLVTVKQIYKLIDVANKKEDFKRVKSYWNTFYCQKKIYSSDGKYYGRYCKNRFCTLCCSIRKADIINRYLPVINTWKEPQFVTLTAKSLKKTNLAKRFDDLNRGLQIIIARYRKRAQRGEGTKLVGIKSLESNFNPVTRTYNPHIHLIVQTKEMAEIIVAEWLKLCTSKFAKRQAQKIIPVTDREKFLKEIVKYSSKIFTEPDVMSKGKNKNDSQIYAAALDNIFAALKGRRIFDRFGFNLPKNERQTNTKVLTRFEEWDFDPKQFDWIEKMTVDGFTGFEPAAELVNLLEYSIDTNTE